MCNDLHGQVARLPGHKLVEHGSSAEVRRVQFQGARKVLIGFIRLFQPGRSEAGE